MTGWADCSFANEWENSMQQAKRTDAGRKTRGNTARSMVEYSSERMLRVVWWCTSSPLLATLELNVRPWRGLARSLTWFHPVYRPKRSQGFGKKKMVEDMKERERRNWKGKGYGRIRRTNTDSSIRLLPYSIYFSPLTHSNSYIRFFETPNWRLRNSHGGF